MKKRLRNKNIIKSKKTVSGLDQSMAFMKKHWLWWLPATIGLIGWLLINAPIALQNLNTFKEWYLVDQELSGYWTNDFEGVLGAPEFTDTNDKITLVLEVKGSDILGEIYSDAISHYFPASWKSFMVRGKKSFNKIDLLAFDYIFGKETETAGFKIETENEVMTITTKYKVPYFPEKFTLIKTNIPPLSYSRLPAQESK